MAPLSSFTANCDPELVSALRGSVEVVLRTSPAPVSCRKSRLLSGASFDSDIGINRLVGVWLPRNVFHLGTIRKSLNRAVAYRLGGDEPRGLDLSHGLDHCLP